ncbi:hypothetical protein PMAYCL1PPCAC_13961, partial [Pristionchus mayeri]
KGDGTIRRLADPVVTPQCIMCEIYPTTACGYMLHLQLHHKTTLLASGVYLLCSCGFRYNTHNDQKNHGKKCTGHEFVLHKLDRMTPQCVLC